MEKIKPEDFSEVSETLLYTLHLRDLENRRPDAILRDPRASELAGRIDTDFNKFHFHNHDMVAVILRLRQFDRLTRTFLAQHPSASVVYIGCGLDTRFERVDNGNVTWYDLDLPPVIALRRKLIPEQPRCTMVACSVLDENWMESVSTSSTQPVLFLAEGVFSYLQPEEVHNLILKLRGRFAGCELVFDATLPWVMRAHKIQFKYLHSPLRIYWSIRHTRELEEWAQGNKLLTEWNFYEEHEPRLGWVNFFGRFAFIAKSGWVLHYRLDKA